MKTPFIVGGAVILVVVAAAAYLELRPTPAVVTVPPAAPAPAALPAPPPAPPAQVAVQPPADCLLPGPPPVAPDGGKADAADMKLGHDVIQSFVVQLEDYQACREKKVATAGSTVTDQQKQTWRDQGNAAIDEANAIAAAFASQLKIYHAKHPEPLAASPAKAP